MPQCRGAPQTTTPQVAARMRGVCILLVMIPVITVSGQTNTIEPTFTRTLDARIDWAELAGPHDSPLLVVWDRDRHLHVVDPCSGRPLFERKLSAGPGLKLGQGFSPLTGGWRFYCYDHFSLHAFDVTAPPGSGGGKQDQAVTHRAFGQAFPGEQFQHDPEVLKRIILVAALGADVVAVRDDGRITRFNTDDAAPRYTVWVGPIARCLFSATPTRAALLLKQGPDARLLWLDVRATGPPPLPPRRIARTLPVWSGSCAAGLLAVWLDHIELHAEHSASVRQCALAAAPRAATVTLHQPVGLPESEPLLVFADLTGGVHAYGVQSARLVWTRPGDAARSAYHRLALFTDEVLIRDDHHVLLLRACDGVTRREYSSVDSISTATLCSDVIHAITETEGTLTWRVLPTGPQQAPLAEARLRAPSRDARQMCRLLWARDCLVVVSSDSLAAYHAPEPPKRRSTSP